MANGLKAKGKLPNGPTVLTIPLSPVFKMIFVSILGLTVLCLGIACSLVALEKTSGEGKVLFELCATAFKLGFGAIIGLVGGKAL
jgi:hypothetical protein